MKAHSADPFNLPAPPPPERAAVDRFELAARMVVSAQIIQQAGALERIERAYRNDPQGPEAAYWLRAADAALAALRPEVTP